MAANPRYPLPASTGMVTRHGPGSWPSILGNYWTGMDRNTHLIAIRSFWDLDHERAISHPFESIVLSRYDRQAYPEVPSTSVHRVYRSHLPRDPQSRETRVL